VIVTIAIPAQSAEALQVCLASLVLLDRVYLRTHRVTPLYRSGVRYRREVSGSEVWQTTPILYAEGVGDCEDLAAHRAAELIESGEDSGAKALIKQVRPGLWHAVVQRGNGKVEDPSKRLGMLGDG
jgi:hypothetical protein